LIKASHLSCAFRARAQYQYHVRFLITEIDYVTYLYFTFKYRKRTFCVHEGIKKHT
jgi:hypothetical protein